MDSIYLSYHNVAGVVMSIWEMDYILADSNGCLHWQRKEFSVQFQDQELGAFPTAGTSRIQYSP